MNDEAVERNETKHPLVVGGSLKVLGPVQVAPCHDWECCGSCLVASRQQRRHEFVPLSCVCACVFGVCLVCVWCMFGVCLMYVWCMFGVCLVYVWCMFGVCLVYVWCMFGVCLVYIPRVQSKIKSVVATWRGAVATWRGAVATWWGQRRRGGVQGDIVECRYCCYGVRALPTLTGVRASHANKASS
jgi:hypothetical protein